MLREAYQNHLLGFNKQFRFRGQEPGRLENFSDAVFALAITLLLISTSPPTSFEQIKLFAWEIIPFGLCISLIVLIWHQHFIFFFRYGLRNPKVIVLNSVFLVIVLFYVYPLKYLTKSILIPIGLLFEQEVLLRQLQPMYAGSNMADLMIIYGMGAALVFLLLTLLYRYALNCADSLGLNEVERFDTRNSMITNILMGVIPLISVIVAIIFRHSVWGGALAGITYFLYPLVMNIFSRVQNKKREELLQISAL
jgi:uncharacterized membrane protein